jgi:hypothetical protein
MIGIIARLAVIVQGQQRDDVDAGTDNCAGAGQHFLMSVFHAAWNAALQELANGARAPAR